MIVVISKFGEIKACHQCMSICKYDAEKKKKKQQQQRRLFRNTPRSCGV